MSLIKKDTVQTRNIAQYTDNEHLRFLILKTEKLASALYLVTGFVQEGDPLRQKLRNAALDLVSASVASRRRQGGELVETYNTLCLEIESLLSMARRSGIISDMNCSVLCEEYSSLASFVKDHCDRICMSDLYISDNTKVPDSKKTTTHRTHIKDKTKASYKRHNDRREKILNLFSTKDKISVKDAASVVEGVSEKTIQRELLSMVDEGVLLKEGERRWSAYKKV